MTRRLRTDRMLRRVRETRTAELLRASGEEIRAKVESGDWTINRARIELGLPPINDPYGDTTIRQRPDGLLGALQRDGLISDDEAAGWQRAWDEIMARDQPHQHRLVVLPQRTVIRPTRPRKSTPRGLPRMREHTISLLLGALRGDGSIEATIRVSTCRAMRVLPWDIGYTHTSRITAGDGKPTGMAAVAESHVEHVVKPMVRYLSSELLPDGLEFVVSEDPRGTQIELARPPTPWIDPNGDPS